MSKNQSGNQKKKFDWIKVDNAGKIYPPSRKRNWTAMFRVSATLNEPVDPKILESAQRSALNRFPSLAVKLKAGMFWYYLQHMDGAPDIQQDVINPCVRIKWKKNKNFMFRVRYFDKTIAVEYFHVLTDGSGGLSFLLTLTAEYLRMKYGTKIEYNSMILNCSESPKVDEFADAFLRFAGDEFLSRKELDAYHIKGTSEPPYVIHRTVGIMSVEQLLNKARELGVTLTEYLAAVMICAIREVQKNDKRKRKRSLPVKVGIPVNLRKLFPTNTKRNFASYINVGIEPRLGEYTIEEIAKIVHCQMALELNEKTMRAKFSTNVSVEKSVFIGVVPLFIKNMVMRKVFYTVGDAKTTTSISNLGNVVLPEEMAKHVNRLDFLLGPLSVNQVVCGVVSYNGSLVFNFVRTIKESSLEREFFRLLVKQGVHVLVESNNSNNH